jgi:hypothetical protein
MFRERLFSAIRPSVFANYCLSDRLPSSTETGRPGLYSSWMISQRNGSQVFELLGYRSFTSKRDRKRIYNCKFSEVKLIKKGSQGSMGRFFLFC